MATYGHGKKANPQYIKSSPRCQGEKAGGTKKEKRIPWVDRRIPSEVEYRHAQQQRHLPQVDLR